MTQQPVDRVGAFRGRIVEYGLREYQSGAVAIAIRAELDEFFDNDEWHPWSEYDQEAHGFVFIIQKSGEANQKAVESLCQFSGWDGSITSITQGTWKPTPCQFSIKENTYNNSTTLQIAFVNAFNSTPGGTLTNVDDNRIKEMEARFGASLRAIAGTVKRAATPPNGSKPSAPPKPAPQLEPVGKRNESDIPF